MEHTEAEKLEKQNKCEFSNYSTLAILGEGTYGKVYKVQYNPTNKILALKIFKPTGNIQKMFEKEITALESVKGFTQCVQIFSPLDVFLKKYRGIAMEYYSEGELLKYVTQKKGLAEQDVRKLLHQIVSILEGLQSRNLSHLDIKAENFFFDEEFNLILGDFGMTEQLNSPNQVLNHYNKGSPSYQLPEIQNQQPYRSFEADVFAAGVTLFAIYSCLLPFKVRQSYSILFSNPDNFWNHMKAHSPNPEFKDNLNKDFIDLFNKMVHINANERIQVEQIKTHPFYIGEEIKQNEQINIGSTIEKINEEINNYNIVYIEDKDSGQLTRGSNCESINVEFYKYEYSIPNLNNERIAKVYNVKSGKLNDFKTNIDPNTLFQYLVVKQSQFSSEVPVLSGKSFKLKCLFQQEQEDQSDQQQIKFDISLQEGDEDKKTYVIFTKRSGDSFEFFKLCAQIQDLIKEFK